MTTKESWTLRKIKIWEESERVITGNAERRRKKLERLGTLVINIYFSLFLASSATTIIEEKEDRFCSINQSKLLVREQPNH